MNLIQAAKDVQSGRACPQDIDLLVKVLAQLGEAPCVVMLGAGEIFTLTVFGAKPKALLYTVDIEEEGHNWERVALANCGIKHVNHVQILGDSVEVAKTYNGPRIDLLIIDSDHSEEGVASDLKAWVIYMAKDGYIFFHDYDAKDAPYYYPGVKNACMRFFDGPPTYIEGWSAVYGGQKEEQPKPKRKYTRKAKK